MDLWPRESFIENSFEIERQKECILRFMKEYMEQLPYELISSILSHLPIEHLVPFLSLHGLPLIRQVVVSDYFSQSIVLRFKNFIQIDDDLNIEEEEEHYCSQSRLDQFTMNTKDNVYDQKRILRLRKAENCIYFKSSNRYIKWSHNLQFTSISLINEILRQDDLKFKHLHFIGQFEDWFKLLSRSSSKRIINNSEKVQISILDRRKFKAKIPEPNVQLLLSTDSLQVRILLPRKNSLILNNLQELTIYDAKVKNWSRLKLGNNLKRLTIACMAFVPIHEIKFHFNLKQLSILNAAIIDGGVVNKNLPSKLTHLSLRDCHVDNDCVLLHWLNHLPRLRSLKLQYNYFSPSLAEPEPYHSMIPNFNTTSKIIWPKDLEVFYFDSIVTCFYGEIPQIKTENIKFLYSIVWPHTIKKLKLQCNHLFELSVFSFPRLLIDLILISKQPLLHGTMNPRCLKFPDSLKRLYIFGYDLLNEVLSFPPNLLELNLVGCKNVDFTAMEFPPSLKFLIIERCDFKYVNDYPYWKELINLEYLSLSGNDITSIDDWNPPPNLKHLLLSKNQMQDGYNLYLPRQMKIYRYGSDFIELPHFDWSLISVDPDTMLRQVLM